ncbi:hypothetical protein JZU46_05275, partial [bacterium]|nr:hypothetical protein [bacterium]
MKKLTLSLLCVVLYTTGLMATTVLTVGGGTTGSPATHYATLKEAFAAINGGLSGTPFDIQIINNTTEAATVLLKKSGVTVLIYPTVAGKTIWGDLNSSLITIEATNNVTIDGRVNRTGTTPDLTIDNPNTGATAATITISSTSANNTVSYCNIKGSGSTLATIPITATNGTNYLNNTLSYNKFTPSTGGRPMTVCSVSGTYGAKLLNNNFENVVKTYGISANNSCVKSKISGNSFYETAAFTPTVAPTYIYFTGNNAPGATNDTISNNYIGGSEAECAGTLTTTGAFNFDFKGISLKNIRTDGLIISNNTIKNITWTNNGSAFFKGITNEQNSTSQGSNIALSINNNFISNIEFSNSTGATTITGIEHLVKNANIYNNIVSLKTNSVGVISGIREELGAYNALTVSNIYNNTVYIGGMPTSGSSASYAFYSKANTNSRNFRNNIFYNARSNSGTASGKHYAIQLNYAATLPSPNTNNVTFTCDYNDYYVTGTGKMLGGTNNTDKSSLTDWQTYTGQDANSSVTDPVIVPGTDGNDFMGGVALTGARGTGITTDFTGAIRRTASMGAFYMISEAATTSDAPTAISATAGDKTASVVFTAPVLDGGSLITLYTVT